MVLLVPFNSPPSALFRLTDEQSSQQMLFEQVGVAEGRSTLGRQVFQRKFNTEATTEQSFQFNSSKHRNTFAAGFQSHKITYLKKLTLENGYHQI